MKSRYKLQSVAFDQVANQEGLALPAIKQQLRYVATNRLTYRTGNGGKSWSPISLEAEAATVEDLANISEMLNNQRAYVASTNQVWIWTANDGWFTLDR